MLRDALLLITTSYPRSGDGSEAAGSFVADLAMELARSIPVRVLAPGNVAATEIVAPNVTVWRFPAPQGNLSNLRLGNPLDVWRILTVLRSGAQAALRATQDGRVKHTLACWALPSGAWAKRLSRKRGIPYSVWMLGSDVWSLGRVPIVRSALSSVMRAASRRYADGLQLARDSEAICNLPVEFLPTTRALTTLDPPPTASAPPYRFVFIGRWHRNKGIDLLLDALALLGDSDWGCIAEVAIYGGGPLRTLVREKAKRLLDAGRPLVIGGFIPKVGAECAIVRADWVLIPSRIESIPVVFSDAMKLSRPVIATPVGDLPQMVAGGCGIVCASVDPPAIASSIRIACRYPEDRVASLAACAKRFSLHNIARQILQGVNGE